MTGFKFKKEKNITDGSISNPYRSKTNKSYKQLTETEKKQVEFLSKIHRMKHKARILGDLRHITNEVLTNCAYHEKNIEEQFKKLDLVNIPKEEREIIVNAWEIKSKLGHSLLKDLEELTIYAKNNY